MRLVFKLVGAAKSISQGPIRGFATPTVCFSSTSGRTSSRGSGFRFTLVPNDPHSVPREISCFVHARATWPGIAWGCLFSMACIGSSSGGHRQQALVVRASVDTAVIEEGHGYAWAVVPIVIRNLSPWPLYVNKCSPEGERLEEGRWRHVTVSSCLVICHSIVPPGDSAKQVFRIMAPTTARTLLPPEEPLRPGIFRVSFGGYFKGSKGKEIAISHDDFATQPVVVVSR